MSAGTLIRIGECIVTIYGGVRLAVRPCKMRWNHIASRIVFGALVVAGMAIESINTFWYKFSGIMTLVLAIYLFFVLLIFYRIHVLQLIAQNFCYWMSLSLLRHFIVCLCAMMRAETVEMYINEQYGQSWHWLHIVSMFIAMVVVLALLYFKRETDLIQCRFNRSYLLFVGIALAEILTEQYIFNDKNLDLVEGKFLFICILIFWTVASFGLLFFAYRNYQEASYHEKISDMNLHTMQKQYMLLQEMYTEKRRQVHDAVHHDVLLIGYLREGKTVEALEYLEKKLEESRRSQRNSYTGIDVIDLMLDYKINEAEKENIRVYLDLDVYFCPIEDTEMCILLGNLLDNAIEATAQLPLSQRRIQVFMRTPNNIFVLQMKNPFKEKRKLIEGHYMTTKIDKERHGLGLDSVKRIVEKYNGSLETDDDGKEFITNVTIFEI